MRVDPLIGASDEALQPIGATEMSAAPISTKCQAITVGTPAPIAAFCVPTSAAVIWRHRRQMRGRELWARRTAVGRPAGSGIGVLGMRAVDL